MATQTGLAGFISAYTSRASSITEVRARAQAATVAEAKEKGCPLAFFHSPDPPPRSGTAHGAPGPHEPLNSKTVPGIHRHTVIWTILR